MDRIHEDTLRFLWEGGTYRERKLSFALLRAYSEIDKLQATLKSIIAIASRRDETILYHDIEDSRKTEIAEMAIIPGGSRC